MANNCIVISNTVKMITDCDLTSTTLQEAIRLLRLQGEMVNQVLTHSFDPKIIELVAEHYPYIHCVVVPAMPEYSWAAIGIRTVIWSPGA